MRSLEPLSVPGASELESGTEGQERVHRRREAQRAKDEKQAMEAELIAMIAVHGTQRRSHALPQGFFLVEAALPAQQVMPPADRASSASREVRIVDHSLIATPRPR